MVLLMVEGGGGGGDVGGASGANIQAFPQTKLLVPKAAKQ
jgi:hypothetical protein